MATLTTTKRYDGDYYVLALITYGTSTSNTAFTISVTNLQEYNSCGWENDGWEFGYYTTNGGGQSNINKSASYGYHFWEAGYTTILGSASQAFARKTSAYSVTLVVRFRTKPSSGWSGWYQDSATFTVPALPSYAVTFNGNGATGGATAAQTKYYGIDLTLRSNGFYKTGYTFLGWSTSSSATTASYANQGKYTGNAALSLYAVWQQAGYTIDYDLDGGTVEAANPAGYSVDTETFVLHNPIKEGYKFVGWTGSNGSIPQKTVTIPIGSTGNKSYTANWSVATNTAIDFYRNTSSSTECITFGGSDETNTNQISSYLPIQLENQVYVTSDELTTAVTNLGWTDVIV